MAQFPAPTEGIALTHFIVSRDVERSRRFYTEVLGGRGGSLKVSSRLSPWRTARSPSVSAEDPQRTSRP